MRKESRECTQEIFFPKRDSTVGYHRKQAQAVATPWLTVTQLPYSAGTPEVTVACTANLEASRRVMDIVFLANNDKDTLLFTVRQAAYSGGTNVDTPNDTPTDQPAYSRGRE